MLDNNHREILDGSEEFIENKIKAYLESGCKVTILKNKKITKTRKVVLIKVKENQHEQN